jgi:protein-L-isoaspartate(D-aspartate) O-methyltransferase
MHRLKRIRSAAILFPALLLFSFASPAPGEEDADSARRRLMVRRDIAGRGISDVKVLEAMRTVPRHRFVLPAYRRQAYADHPLPIGEGQTISQPYVVALMTEALELRGTERVLEIGTGSGYQAAVLSEIVPEVYSIEIIPPLATRARATLKAAGYGGVQVKTGDGYGGWPEMAPFDAIIITAAANHVPPLLIDQLKVGGRLILPLGRTTHMQTLTLVTKEAEKLVVDQMGGVRFVPMVGEAQKPAPARAAPK